MMLTFKGRQYKCSRVAWLMVTGNWPENLVDHENRDKRDDRFLNLRQATYSENSRNMSARSDNRLGVKGVSKARGKRHGFTSVIMVHGAQKYLGYFPSIESAKDAYDQAAQELHGEFARA